MSAKLVVYLFLILLTLYFMFKVFVQNAFVINERLEKVRTDVNPNKNDKIDTIDDFIESGKLYNIPLIGKFYEKQIESLTVTNIQMKPKEYLIASVGIFILFLVIATWLSGKLSLGLVLGVIGLLIPNVYVNILKAKRHNKLNAQLPEFLNTLSNALRSGLSLQQAIDISTEEALEPIKWEFKKVLSDMSIGRTTQDAFDNLKERTKNKNIDLLVNAISVQIDVGGNLSEVLDLLASTIRANEKLQRHFKSTVAQNKLSGMIIGFLPVALAAVLTVMSPDYMAPLFTEPLGKIMLGGAVIMMGLGLFIVRKITELEV